jgi:phosphonate transport system permease protein
MRRQPMPMAPQRRKAGWLLAAVFMLVVASFWSLDLKWREFLAPDARSSMAQFVASFFPPETSAAFLRKTGQALIETLAMSALGTLIAAVAGLLMALPASRTHAGDPARAKPLARLLLNALRSVPELVWAALLLIAAGLGPFPGTLALAIHTTGVLGRLFAENIENAQPGPAFALRVRGVSETRIFLYATLPQIWPQVVSYTLYRWENNIRAAAVLGVVGAGGLGQMLSYHLGLFQMHETCTVLIGMVLLVAGVDAISYLARRRLDR